MFNISLTLAQKNRRPRLFPSLPARLGRPNRVLPQCPVDVGLIAVPFGGWRLEPYNHIGIQAQRQLLLERAVELALFGILPEFVRQRKSDGRGSFRDNPPKGLRQTAASAMCWRAGARCPGKFARGAPFCLDHNPGRIPVSSGRKAGRQTPAEAQPDHNERSTPHGDARFYHAPAA
jgi:hypothetical protein